MQHGIALWPPAGLTCRRPAGGRVRCPLVLASLGGRQAAESGPSRRGVRLPFSELGGIDSREHVVRGRGAGDDTLDGLCARYGVLPAEVVDANPGLVRHAAQQFKPGTKVLILAPDAVLGTSRRVPQAARRGAQGEKGRVTAATVAAEPNTSRRPAAGPAVLDVAASAVLLTVAVAGWLASARRSAAGEGVTNREAVASAPGQALRLPAPRFIPSWRAAEAMTASAPPGVPPPAPSTSGLVRVSDAEARWRRESREHVARAADAGISLAALWNLAVAAACSAAAAACNAAAWAALQALRLTELLRRGVSFVFVDAGSAAIEPPVTHRAAEALRASATRARQADARGSRPRPSPGDASFGRRPGSAPSSSRRMNGGNRGRV